MSFQDTPVPSAEQQQEQHKNPFHLAPISKSDGGISQPSAAANTTGRQLPTPHTSKQTTPDPSTDPTHMSSHTPPIIYPVRPENVQHIWVVAGPAGCGKSTIGKYLSTQCSIPYLEGDDFHPPSNKEKMSNGIPLTDADRWDWLVTLREESIKSLTHPSSTVSSHTTTTITTTTTSSSTSSSPNLPHGVIITCSSLKRKYRDVLRIATYTHPNIHIHFLFLRATESMLQERVAARQGHYMKSDMVRSQFLNLEVPDEDELVRDDGDGSGSGAGDVTIVDTSGRPEVVQERALRGLGEVLRRYDGHI